MGKRKGSIADASIVATRKRSAKCARLRTGSQEPLPSAFIRAMDAWRRSGGILYILAQHLPSAVQDLLPLTLVNKAMLDVLCPPCECGSYLSRVCKTQDERAREDASPPCGPGCQRGAAHWNLRIGARCESNLLGKVSQWNAVLRSPFAMRNIGIQLYGDTITHETCLAESARLCDTALRLPTLVGLTYVSMPNLLLHGSQFDCFASNIARHCAKHLTFLDLSRSFCSDGGVSVSLLGACQKLEVLRLGSCRGLEAVTWPAFPRLKLLDLGCNTELRTVRHQGMPRLQSLRLHGCSSLQNFSPLRTEDEDASTAGVPVWVNLEGTDFNTLDFLTTSRMDAHYVNLKRCRKICRLGEILRGDNLRSLLIDQRKELMEEIRAYGNEMRQKKRIVAIGPGLPLSHGANGADVTAT